MKDQSHNRSGFAAQRLLPLITLGCVVIALLCSQALSVEQGDEELDTTRAALEQWVETRRVISKEKRDWALGKEVLNDRIEIVADEIESLQGRIDEAEGDIAEADKKRVELLLENDALKAASASLEESIVELEARTLSLLKRLPVPIIDRVRPLSQQIPADAAETKLSLSIRFQNVIGVLNMVNKYNLEISHNNEVHDIGGGVTAEVTAMYLGLGQSYYTNSNGTVAAVGRPTEYGWQWTPANNMAAEIHQAISILQGEEQASFVQLPISIQQ
jgi:Protein of unknown function (DUF3450)